MGELDGIKGIFPNNFVEVIEEEFGVLPYDNLMLLNSTKQFDVSCTQVVAMLHVLALIVMSMKTSIV